jgi:hypothetical protein
MTEAVTEEFPCARGCVWESLIDGESARPKPAKHGVLCSSCFYRLKNALELVPDLMANMRAKVDGHGATPINERVGGSGDIWPAPLRIDPLDASDSLYAKLVSWTELIGGELHVPQPSVAVWINFREVQGSKPVTPSVAHELATVLTDWFLVRLEDVAASSVATEFHDDIVYGWEDARGVFSLAGSYGVEPRPVREADKRECPVCGAREVFVKMPDKLDPDVAVMCAACEWIVPQAKVDQFLRISAA